ncbi:hypothetical protein HNR42_000498 [Deinobacterium chartae]|uniref:DUF3830 family protein n=1 Tax=Deinobacterium chartae TaxID=521158 RepID=A0A841HWR4_9DEIO|nr:DUF3830 family protein [Deinobacterium chartae]MBB6097084.1 hypothetical protein [Deinobacterium chartae]
MLLTFRFGDEVLRADLDPANAPRTCEALTGALVEPVRIRVKHAMFTGPEMSMQLPHDRYAHLLEVPQEAATILPQPGQVLFTPLPAYVWPGARTPILDLGLYYGPHARTFFPVGWLPGNAFARVRPEDFEAMRRIGAGLLDTGARDVELTVQGR